MAARKTPDRPSNKPSSKPLKESRDTQREKIEAREATILGVATEVFAEQGVDGATMAQIARRCGVAEGTLYLYYRNKHNLLARVVGHFWEQLTQGAVEAIDPQAPVVDQLRQLGNYHLRAVMNQFRVVEMTHRARMDSEQPEQELDQIRSYVRVYDRLIQRGIDRGEFRPDMNLWQSRDVFYGALEYSARTLTLRGEPWTPEVVDNLIALFAQYSPVTEEPPQGGNHGDEVSNRQLLERLIKIERTLAIDGKPR